LTTKALAQNAAMANQAVYHNMSSEEAGVQPALPLLIEKCGLKGA